MKILLVHNDYAKYSGEEAVVDKMDRLFRDLGHEVVQLRMSTANHRDSLRGKAKGFVAGISSPAGVKAMRDIIAREKPDIVNVHNLYPFISPAALRECKKAGIPVIMTVHNYRLICPTGLFMRDNMPCELCLCKGNEWSCVKYNCENSMLKSVGYAARNAVARLKRHYLDCVDRFACLTEFQKGKLIEAGFPENKITVIPNSIEVTHLPTFEGASAPYVAYSGRLSREKGVDLIIEVARRHPEISFKLAGAVRDKELVDNLPPNVQLMGYLSGDDLENFYRDAAFFVMASKWYEGFPMTILETARYKKTMVAPNHGGFTEIISKGDDSEEGDIGILFKPNDTDDLEKAIVELWCNPERVKELGERAFKKVKSNYSTEVVKAKWNRLIQQSGAQ